jgi:hypothetical protein
MPIDQPEFLVYRDHLSALSHGPALWNPNPNKKIYNDVSIGDVGYMQEGAFIRMFNVTMPSYHPSNEVLGVPEDYDPLDSGPFINTTETYFGSVNHCSRFVTPETNLQGTTPDE